MSLTYYKLTMKFSMTLVCYAFVCGGLWAADYVVVHKTKRIDRDEQAHAVLCSKIKRMPAMTWVWTKEGNRQINLSMHTFHICVEMPTLENLDLIEDDSIEKFEKKHDELTEIYNRFPKAQPFIFKDLKAMRQMLHRLDNGDVCVRGHWLPKPDYLAKKRDEAEAREMAEERARIKEKAEAEERLKELARKKAAAEAKAVAEVEARRKESEENRLKQIAQLRADIEKLKNDIASSQKDCHDKLNTLEKIAVTP